MLLDFISHPQYLLHVAKPRHPERPERLAAVMDYLSASGLKDEFNSIQAQPISEARIKQLHKVELVNRIYSESAKLQGTDNLYLADPDTGLCAESLYAAELAAGAVQIAVERVLGGHTKRAFCAVRPPGHHAEEGASMGFCIFNNIALGAMRALEHADINRVAILDFDVHHGNGTVDLFKDRPEVLVCSSFQHPHYPNRLFDIKRDNIINTPLDAGTTGSNFRKAIERDWLPALEKFKPDLIMVSAGFDAHKEDPLADLLLDEDDYTWITQLIVAAANEYSQGRIVSTLEGGYSLDALARSVAVHLEALRE